MTAIVGGKPLDEAAAQALGAAAYSQCHPLINVAYDQDYRREMVPVYVRRAVREAAGVNE